MEVFGLERNKAPLPKCSRWQGKLGTAVVDRNDVALGVAIAVGRIAHQLDLLVHPWEVLINVSMRIGPQPPFLSMGAGEGRILERTRCASTFRPLDQSYILGEEPLILSCV